jgi:hypothetical protein
MMDSGVQLGFNDDLFCVIDEVEKSRNEKINTNKRQNLWIQSAVVKFFLFH